MSQAIGCLETRNLGRRSSVWFVLLIAHHVDATFGNITVTDLGTLPTTLKISGTVGVAGVT